MAYVNANFVDATQLLLLNQDRAVDTLLRYLDSQFMERHPRLKPLGAAHPDVLALARGAAPPALPFRRGGARGPQAAAAATARASSLIMDTLRALLPDLNSVQSEDATTESVTALLKALQVMVQATNQKLMSSKHLSAYKFEFLFTGSSADRVASSHTRSEVADRGSSNNSPGVLLYTYNRIFFLISCSPEVYKIWNLNDICRT